MKNIATAQFPEASVTDIARGARVAARQLASLSHAQRNDALLAAAQALVDRRAEIVAANELDSTAALRDVEAGKMSQAMFQRLKTNEGGIAEMAARVRDVASLPDPLGRTLAATELDDGLTLYKISCPLGVIGIIFESRPDVIPQVAALALKSGNAVIFKGGSEARHTNAVLASIWREALAPFTEIPSDMINLMHTREDVAELLTLADEIDLIIPRGSQEFVRYIAETSRIPVLGHGEGICHVYVDRAADLEKALAVAFDSKVQYPAACNAMETLLVHEEVAPDFLPAMIAQFKSAAVEVRGCPRTIALTGREDIVPAQESDWTTEYSDLIVSIKVVATADEAIEHIQRSGSGHTESIVTEDQELATRFMEAIDAAGVYHNVSTRFADGFRYGLGAELGISTSKLHARGPVGLEGLTTYKYQLFGDGHTVAMYSKGERAFKHRPIS
ncbi:MAG TPA: glutamate-5-semialdehyde dehydrogenase [Pyrinomonadaceae bacterium]|jgi:glutamate-5-semialdehyde dehydrogenase|nr:glutamate-5-semialdehyde dehydrogenase [Pyrinomonadaceae bacterium]